MTKTSAASSQRRQLDPADEPVDEPDVVLEPERRDAAIRPCRYASPSRADEVRVGRADDDVQHGRMGRDDGGQGVDRELVALARTEQAEAEDDLAALDRPSRGLTVSASTSGRSGTPCGMTCEPARLDAVGAAQEVAADRDITTVASVSPIELRQDDPLPARRVTQDGVQRRDRGDVEARDEVEDVLAVLAAPDPVLVLDRDQVDASPRAAAIRTWSARNSLRIR